MEVAITPFYLDWSFWAVFIAGLALLLSQLPPIHVLLKKVKIDFELYSKISITHKVGNPNLQIHIIINNIGGRKVRIKGIEAKIIRDENEIVTLPSQNFLQDPSDKNNVLFTSFALNPNEEWGHIVNLLKFFGREEEKSYRRLEGDLKSDIFGKRKLIKGEVKELIEADKEKVEPLITFFNENFIWFSGEYKLNIKVVTDKEDSNVEKSYGFTLFEYYEQELRKITEEYKFGTGIYWESKTPRSVILNIKEM